MHRRWAGKTPEPQRQFFLNESCLWFQRLAMKRSTKTVGRQTWLPPTKSCNKHGRSPTPVDRHSRFDRPTSRKRSKKLSTSSTSDYQLFRYHKAFQPHPLRKAMCRNRERLWKSSSWAIKFQWVLMKVTEMRSARKRKKAFSTTGLGSR